LCPDGFLLQACRQQFQDVNSGCVASVTVSSIGVEYKAIVIHGKILQITKVHIFSGAGIYYNILKIKQFPAMANLTRSLINAKKFPSMPVSGLFPAALSGFQHGFIAGYSYATALTKGEIPLKLR
jgi:hypothetical protein